MEVYVITDNENIIGVTSDYENALKIKEKISFVDIETFDTENVDLMCEGYKEYCVMQTFDGNCIVKWFHNIISYGIFNRPWEIKYSDNFKYGVHVRAKSEEDAIDMARGEFKKFEEEQRLLESQRANQQMDRVIAFFKKEATDINEVL